MKPDTVRTTVALPASLLDEVDSAVRKGLARSRNDLVRRALRRELALQERAAIDAAFAAMADDVEYHKESIEIEREFAAADAEAWRFGERQSSGGDVATR